MSASFPCPACEMGDHAKHIELWKVREGIIGGAICPCKGDCKPPDLSVMFPLAALVGDGQPKEPQQ